MLILKNIDIILTCSLFILLYTFIANERSLMNFKEINYKILSNKNNITDIIYSLKINKKVLIYIPVIYSIILGLIKLNVYTTYYSYLFEESKFNIKNGIKTESIKEIANYLYLNIDNFAYQVLSFINYYNFIIIIAGLVLSIYVVKNKNQINKNKRVEIYVIFIIQLIIIMSLLIIINMNYENKIFIQIMMIIESLVMSYIMSIAYGVFFRILIMGFNKIFIKYKDILNQSIINNKKIFYALLINNLFHIHYIVIFKKYEESMFYNYQNTFNSINFILSIILPILIVRFVIFNRSFKIEIQKTFIFIRKNMSKIRIYVLVICVLNMIMNYISKSIIITSNTILYIVLNIIKFMIIFPTNLLVILGYSFVIYKMSLTDDKQNMFYFKQVNKNST